jgi:hypothetical protein
MSDQQNSQPSIQEPDRDETSDDQASVNLKNFPSSTPVKDPQSLNKSDIKRLISIKSGSVSYTEYEDKKSEVWNQFKIVNIDNVRVNFVHCSACDAVFSWHKGSGTKSLGRHLPCPVPEPVTKQKPGGSVSSNPMSGYILKAPGVSSVDRLNTVMVVGFAMDLRPLAAVEGNGFKMIAQSLVDFGAKYGQQDITKVLNHRTTLKKKFLPQVVGNIKKNMIDSLKFAQSSPRYAFTTDMWTDKYKQRHFLSLTIHYIDKTFKLKSNLLAVDEFPDTKKSTANIREECLRILDSYFGSREEAEIVMNKAVIVTDGGSNMLKVFPTRLSCMCHKLNLVLEHLFSEEKLQAKFPWILDNLHSMKELVTFFKRSGLNSKLNISLKQAVSTRWNSNFIMLESYVKASSQVKQVLLEKGMLNKVKDIDDELVSDLIKFLEPFKKCSDQLSADTRPTIDKVVVWYHKLMDHINKTDSIHLPEFSEEAMEWFQKYFVPDSLHYVACILNPL